MQLPISATKLVKILVYILAYLRNQFNHFFLFFLVFGVLPFYKRKEFALLKKHVVVSLQVEFDELGWFSRVTPTSYTSNV